MKCLFRFSVAALLSLGASMQSRADFMDWSYHWSISPGPVLSSGTGSVAMTLAQDGNGASSIPAATVTTSSSATNAAPDAYKVGYNLMLQLKDDHSNKSGTLTYHGFLSGTVSATSSHLTNSFSSPTTERLLLGGHLYSVTINPSLMTLAPPGSAVLPQIDALVRVTNPMGHPIGGPTPQVQGPPPSAGSPGPAHSTPEPSSLVLGMLAFGGLGMVILQRRFCSGSLVLNAARL